MPDQVEWLGGTISLSGFAGLPGFISAEDAKKHNVEIDLVFRKYEEYLEVWPSIVNRYRRSVELKFVLENSGGAPADDVHLKLWTEADGVWLEELPNPPIPPTMPKRRDLFDAGLYAHTPYLEPSTFRVASRDSDGPTIRGGRSQMC